MRTVRFGDVEIGGGMPPAIALSVSDLLDPVMISERVSAICELGERFGSVCAICVRNDSMSGERLVLASVFVRELWGKGIVIESGDPGCIGPALAELMGSRPLICSAERGNIQQLAMAASLFDCPLAVRGADVEETLELAETAEEMGVADIVLNPGIVNMKQCLERSTDLMRLDGMCGFAPADRPIMVRSWSGEYALSMSAVSVLRYGSLMVLDDLDPDGCAVIDSLISSVRGRNGR